MKDEYYIIHFLNIAREHIGFSDDDIKPGDVCLAKVEEGEEFCVSLFKVSNKMLNEIPEPDECYQIRKANDEDIERMEWLKRRREDAFRTCTQMAIECGLEMKLVNVSIAPNGNKITFYYTADGRVDFRELVRELAGRFRTRIEMRQIGVRDEAQIVGGLGPCMSPICCTRFLRDFESISLQMAKVQGLNLIPAKISGLCGRLMCCLYFEYDVYKSILLDMPEIGSKAMYKDEEVIVRDVYPLMKMVMISKENMQTGEDNLIVPLDEIVFERREIKCLPGRIA